MPAALSLASRVDEDEHRARSARQEVGREWRRRRPRIDVDLNDASRQGAKGSVRPRKALAKVGSLRLFSGDMAGARCVVTDSGASIGEYDAERVRTKPLPKTSAAREGNEQGAAFVSNENGCRRPTEREMRRHRMRPAGMAFGGTGSHPSHSEQGAVRVWIGSHR